MTKLVPYKDGPGSRVGKRQEDQYCGLPQFLGFWVQKEPPEREGELRHHLSCPVLILNHLPGSEKLGRYRLPLKISEHVNKAELPFLSFFFFNNKKKK